MNTIVDTEAMQLVRTNDKGIIYWARGVGAVKIHIKQDMLLHQRLYN